MNTHNIGLALPNAINQDFSSIYPVDHNIDSKFIFATTSDFWNTSLMAYITHCCRVGEHNRIEILYGF